MTPTHVIVKMFVYIHMYLYLLHFPSSLSSLPSLLSFSLIIAKLNLELTNPTRLIHPIP